MIIDSFKGEYDFLSNFHECRVQVGKYSANSSEHLYQAFKTKDEYARWDILRLPTPSDTKKAGKRVVLRPDWEQVKFSIMCTIVSAKFTQSYELADKLLATGTATLVEGNWWGDTYWGVCRGVGENHLGQILMAVRDDLKIL